MGRPALLRLLGFAPALLLAATLLALAPATSWGEADTAGSFLGQESVAASSQHSCAIRANSELDCWGDGGFGQLDNIPDGPIRSVSAGAYFTCAIRIGGELSCWGRDDQGQVSGTPAGEFRSVAAGGAHGCAIRTNGELECWGDDTSGQATPPVGEFGEIASGGAHSCAIRTNGELECWGDDTSGQATPPVGEFRDISAGDAYSCAIEVTGGLACWGDDTSGQATPPVGEFRAVEAGSTHICAIRINGELECWGSNTFGQLDGAPTGKLREVSSGQFHNCAVRANGEPVCWGVNDDMVTDTPTDLRYGIPRVSSGLYHTCGIRTTGELACWGDDAWGQTSPPPGEFRAVSSGHAHTCAVRAGGALACWGGNFAGQLDNVLSGEFRSVTAGGTHSCAIDGDGELACWGDNTYGQGNGVPSGRFKTVEAGGRHTCAIRANGELVCWGDNTFGQLASPPGEFRAVSSGDWHSCAVRADGELLCWGDSSSGEATPPAGEFTSVTAGGTHTCGTRADGELVCWGDNSLSGQTTPPAGALMAVSSGELHSCAVGGGVVICWGDDVNKQSLPELIDGPLVRAIADAPYSHQFESTPQGPAPEVSLADGALPDGLTLAADGELSGVPTVAGDFTFTVSASNGLTASSEQEATLVVVGTPLLAVDAAGDVTQTSARLSATINPRNLSADAWFEYWPSGQSPDDAQRTAVQDVAKGVALEGISAGLAGLSPGTTYDYRLAATNELDPDPVYGETASFTTPSPPGSSPPPDGSSAGTQDPDPVTPVPPPIAGKSIVATPTEGRVEARCPGDKRFSQLDSVERIPVGCVVDVRNGTIALTSATGRGGATQTARFWDGVFRVDQASRSAEIVLTLVGALDCGKSKAKSVRGFAAKKRPKGKSSRRLWGSGKGRYRTKGKFGSASVRGTTWLVVDYCDQTQFKVTQGTIVVSDFTARKTITLRKKGQRYVAHAKPSASARKKLRKSKTPKKIGKP